MKKPDFKSFLNKVKYKAIHLKNKFKDGLSKYYNKGK